MAASGTVAIVANREGGNSAALLARMAAEWRADGVSVVGVLAQDNDDAEATCSAGFLRDIATGQIYSIHLDVPPADADCHIDAGGMSEACSGLMGQIAAADLVILSKFGKLEAAKKGLFPAFAAAIAAGKPLLTTVSPKHVDALKTFAPAAAWLGADDPSLAHWWQAARSAGPAA